MSHVTSISPAFGCSSHSVQRCGVRSFQRMLPPDAWKRASMASDLRDGLPSMMWYCTAALMGGMPSAWAMHISEKAAASDLMPNRPESLTAFAIIPICSRGTITSFAIFYSPC